MFVASDFAASAQLLAPMQRIRNVGPPSPTERFSSDSEVRRYEPAAFIQFPPDQATSTKPASAPTSRPGEFRPGVVLDWQARTVRVQAHVVLDRGPLEFLACGPGKEHESILLLDASGKDVFFALGLMGNSPGSPPHWDEQQQRFSPAAGGLVDLRLRWTADGKTQECPWTDWVLDAEYLRIPLERPFVFAGSRMRPDQRLSCDVSGAVIALVNMPDSLLAPARSRSDRTDDLWAVANSRLIPPIGTQVQICLTAAAQPTTAIVLDFRGDFRVNGRIERPEEVAERVHVLRELTPTRPVPISVQGALEADVRKAAAALRALNTPDSAIEFQRPSPPASAPGSPTGK
ncbi:MAG: hypothetical protein HZB38_06285 [Planctomycetes bacterium]|nr:hypothetical protein [Planctomycetota bacterium]